MHPNTCCCDCAKLRCPLYVYVPKQLSVRRKRRSKFCRMAESVATSFLTVPPSVKTASGKKLALSSPSALETTPSTSSGESALVTCGEPDTMAEMTGYRLVSCEVLTKAISDVGKCTACDSTLTVREDLASRRGLVLRMTICCTVCDQKVHVSEPYSDKAKSLNTKYVLAMR